MTKPFDSTSTTEEVLGDIRLDGKRVLITGTSAGIGVETARALVARGATVIGAVRSTAKAEQATQHVTEAAQAGGGSFSLIELDLASLASVRAAADALVAQGQALNLIIANAGVMASPFGHTTDGFETQFGTNHLGHFVFINRLLPLLKPGARIINLASSGHRYSDVNLDDPNFERTEYDPFVAYGRSKTANILFAVALDNRLKAQGIRAAAVHPGGIKTELDRHMAPGALEGLLEGINVELAAEGKPAFELKTVPQGAATTVWAAVVAPADEIGGRYCENCHVSEVVPDTQKIGPVSEGARAYALDSAHAEALWAKSEELVGERF